MTPILEDPPIHELDHERIDELEARAEQTDIRDGLSLLLSILAAGAAITAVGLVIAFNGGDDEQVVTQAPAAADSSATGAAHDHSTHATPSAATSRQYKRPDPTLPAPPAGDVKKFRVGRLRARHEGLGRPARHARLVLRGERQVQPRHRRLRADGRHPGRQGRDHARERRLEGDGRADAALDRLPLLGGRPERGLQDDPAGRDAPVQLRREAPGRLHVPLRDRPGPDAHGRRHGRHDGRQAEEPGAGRPRAVDDPAGVLHRRGGPGRRPGQDGREDA